MRAKMTALASALIIAITAVPMTAWAAASGDAAASGAEASAEAWSPDRELAPAEITVFAAKSLGKVMDELISLYNESQPDIKILGSYDSSGTLMTQIEEGADCDIFFSAAQKQMNELEEKGLLVEGSRADVVNNQVCVVTYKDSGTEVTGLSDLPKAKSFALADGSVPVGRYTRTAMVNAGMIEAAEDPAAITTQEVSEALGGVEINECANVGAVTAAVAEGANEVGTVYYSDTYGFEDDLVILEVIPYELTGDVIYPVARVNVPGADEAREAAADDFLSFLTSEEAKAVYQSYYFDTDVE